MRPSLALQANADRVATILSHFDLKNPKISARRREPKTRMRATWISSSTQAKR